MVPWPGIAPAPAAALSNCDPILSKKISNTLLPPLSKFSIPSSSHPQNSQPPLLRHGPAYPGVSPGPLPPTLRPGTHPPHPLPTPPHHLRRPQLGQPPQPQARCLYLPVPEHPRLDYLVGRPHPSPYQAHRILQAHSANRPLVDQQPAHQVQRLLYLGFPPGHPPSSAGRQARARRMHYQQVPGTLLRHHPPHVGHYVPLGLPVLGRQQVAAVGIHSHLRKRPPHHPGRLAANQDPGPPQPPILNSHLSTPTPVARPPPPLGQ